MGAADGGDRALLPFDETQETPESGTGSCAVAVTLGATAVAAAPRVSVDEIGDAKKSSATIGGTSRTLIFAQEVQFFLRIP